jgi:uncharacterized protein YbaP (TraB family)
MADRFTSRGIMRNNRVGTAPSRRRGIALALAVCFMVWAAAPPAPDGLAAAAGKKSLWKVASKGNVVYLLGSIHYLKPKNYPLDPVIEAAFKDSKRVMFEIDLDDAKGEQTQHLVVSKAAYTDGSTLKNHLSETTYKLAEEKLGQLGLDIAVFQPFKPWFAANMILARAMQEMGYDPGQGIDQYFFRKAKQETKEIGGLETLESQLDLFNKMPDFVQDLMLLQTVRGADTMPAAVETIVKAWSSGDLKTLDGTLLHGMREFPEVYQRVIVERNREWLPQIESFLAENVNYLVVVGAGHLAGRDGLIEALKAKGYSVEQL